MTEVVFAYLEHIRATMCLLTKSNYDTHKPFKNTVYCTVLDITW